jgi:hypothetical protein
MPRPKVYADFQNLDGANRLRLTGAGTRQDLKRYGIALHEGCVLTFYMDDADEEGRPDDLLAEGTVRFNLQEQCWVAEIDWAALRHSSDDSSAKQLPVNGPGEPPPVEDHRTKRGT